MVIVISWLLAAAGAFLVRLLATSFTTESDLTSLLTFTAAVTIAAILLWVALSITVLRHAQRRRDRRLLRLVRHFGAPVIRRLAAVSLTAPLAFSVTPAFAHVQPESERPVSVIDDPAIDLSWGAPLPAAADTPEYSSLLASPALEQSLATQEPGRGHTNTSTLAHQQSSLGQLRANDERPEEEPHSKKSPTAVVVKPGDNLWKIAQQIRPHDDPTQLSELVALIWNHNRQVIGDNPHLILPGQELLIPHT